MPDAVQGHVDDRFAPVRDVFEKHLASGQEVGASLAVDLDGETVVDLWGGHADAARTRPWERDTVVNVWSVSKTITSLAALVLIDRGLLDPAAPVARYWPEFAQNGKEDVTVAHLMSHTSGVSSWEKPWSIEEYYDWDRSTAALARQAPWWPPGTASGYHASNQGHLVGEVVRRITGRPLREFVRTELAEPTGADVQIGLAPADDQRRAEILPPPGDAVDFSQMDPDSPMVKTFSTAPTDATKANDEAWRRADMGAVNAHTNARGLIRLMSAVSRGGVAGGVRLLRPETVERIFDVHADGVDLVLGVPLRWGLGFGLPQPETVPFIPREKVCFWCGWGGSAVAMYPDRRMTVGYTMNAMGPGLVGSDRTAAYFDAIHRAVG
ncbi:EstA family serine hydrolase [Amycolatopsis jejuensis]|uniref:EstA family serine hydrolase n=1 Tax=Amycolatopsis jejuensis TaxID=330084 RepID=UPI000524FBBB|nr:EstA family serine hydrolase [Amycolatopsis jejuensis]